MWIELVERPAPYLTYISLKCFSKVLPRYYFLSGPSGRSQQLRSEKDVQKRRLKRRVKMEDPQCIWEMSRHTWILVPKEIY